MEKEQHKVLIVDDDPDSVSFVKNLFESRGCRVAVASSIAEILRRADEESYGLVMVAVQMAHLDGPDSIHVLARCQPQAVISLMVKGQALTVSGDPKQPATPLWEHEVESLLAATDAGRGGSTSASCRNDYVTRAEFQDFSNRVDSFFGGLIRFMALYHLLMYEEDK